MNIAVLPSGGVVHAEQSGFIWCGNASHRMISSWRRPDLQIRSVEVDPTGFPVAVGCFGGLRIRSSLLCAAHRGQQPRRAGYLPGFSRYCQ